MKKKIIRLTENDITKIVKRVLNEQGGYDDLSAMASHKGMIQGSLKRNVMNIIDIVDQTVAAFEKDIPKEGVMEAIIQISDVLDEIETSLKEVKSEILLNSDLKEAAIDLLKKIETGKAKLRMLSGRGSQYSRIPSAITGIGMDMPKNDLNDKLTDILIEIGNSAEKLAFQVNDEDFKTIKRLGGFDMDQFDF